MAVRWGIVPPAMHEPDTRHRFVSVREAADYLGISETEVRRRIKSGSLEAERLARPQGTILRVRIDMSTQAPPASTDAPARASTQPETPEAFARLLDFAETLMRAQGETIIKQADENATLRERLGRAEERTRAAEQRADRLQTDANRIETDLRARIAEKEADLEAARRPWWKSW